jgi:hypothetical protein
MIVAWMNPEWPGKAYRRLSEVSATVSVKPVEPDGGGGGMTAASVALFPLLAGPSRPARVLGIVTGAVYLQVDPLAAADSRDGRDHPGAVLALLSPDAVRLPIGMVLPATASALVPVSVAGATVSSGPITVGWGAIVLAGTRWPVLRWWNPGVPVLARPEPAITAEAADSAPAPPEQLAAGLASLAAGDAELAVRQLIGAGPGLTPAGDDVLCGALAALAAWAPDSVARRRLAEAVAAAAGRTTRISAALLQSAVAGCAVPELTRYLTALSPPTPPGTDSPSGAACPGVEEALREVTAVGASSGAAMALGVLHQLRFLHSRAASRAA